MQKIRYLSNKNNSFIKKSRKMSRKNNRKSHNHSGFKKKSYLENVVSSSNLGYLKKELKKHESNIAELDENLTKIKNITDIDAEIYINKIKQLFHKLNTISSLPKKPVKPEHGFLKSVFMKWEKDIDNNLYKDQNDIYQESLKKRKILLDEIIIDFDSLKDEINNKYGAKLWSYTSYDSNYEKNIEIRLQEMYMTKHGFCSTLNKSNSIKLINSPSDLRSYLQNINTSNQTRTIVENISNRINFVESLPKNLREEKSKSIVARDEGKSRILARSVRNELDITKSCPYCACTLGVDYHADHIIPVSYGGHSVRQNMVNVCSTCNLKKGGDSLLNFCQKNGYDFMVIAKRLQSMGKRI